MNPDGDRLANKVTDSNVSGNLVQAHSIGELNIHGSRIVVAAQDDAPAVGWRGRAELRVGGERLLLHDPVTESLSGDGAVRRHQALAQRLSSPHGYVWLRHDAVLRPTVGETPGARALDREAALLDRLGRRTELPRIVVHRADTTGSVLALHWPERTDGGPCDTLARLLERAAGPLAIWPAQRLLTALAELAGTLARLHAHGLSHRLLEPTGIIAASGGRLLPRDLGAAAQPPAAGEGPGDHQAPEQSHRGYGVPGPATDAYRLAAIAYHLVMGVPPHPRHPLPVPTDRLPSEAGRALADALAAEPGNRPDLSELGRRLLTAYGRY
ncbi:serine/threonine-protein kinase [Allonocardiopsis opalescens]|uniref:serine/threonine-protein kinase n=1 Tax=Allonocardiopsis opalescens TaxID=1144618 RepID=UPI000D0785D9|nr:serine/threonine-protein kinase [Allonocardiopsis opalescens]